MSILDIYSAIFTIGRNNPGSLIEVSVFSHAYFEGPILVNSIDDGFVHVHSVRLGMIRDERMPVPPGMRDPDDKDGRTLKDFVAPNMKPEDLLAFRTAFDPKGYFWVWGCNFPRVVNKVLRLVEKNPRYAPSISDEQILECSALKKDEIESFLAFNNIFNFDEAKFTSTRRCKVQFGSIKDALWARTAASYTYQLADKTKVRAIGALFGTYADFFGGCLN